MSVKNQEMSATQWKWAKNTIFKFVFLSPSFYYEKQIPNAY